MDLVAVTMYITFTIYILLRIKRTVSIFQSFTVDLADSAVYIDLI